MRLAKDSDGDLWEEGYDFLWRIRTGGYLFESKTLSQLKSEFGPIVIFDSGCRADKSVYRITYADGSVKHGNRRVLGAVMGAARTGWLVVAMIERISKPEWEDVTAEFIKAG